MTDRRTDGIAMAYTRYSIYAVARKNCLKERIGNQGQRVDFLDRRRISTSGFAYTATGTAVSALYMYVVLMGTLKVNIFT